MPEITLPHNWRPRDYQLPLWKYLEGGGRRATAIWHRRAGKDDVCLHWTATAAIQRPAVYWHMLPQAAQARKAIWDAVNPHTGLRRIEEAFPPEVAPKKRDNDMAIKFINGATWQVVGSDNYNSLVGTPPVGVVFSEWALADPQAWAYIRPILAENNGWALFITTPRGRNHAFQTYKTALEDDSAFAQVLTAEQTSVFSPETLASERLEYIAEFGPEVGEAMFQQEYYCSFDAAVIGAYYAHIITRLEQQGRVGDVPHDPAVPVYTAWDLGIGDSTAIWFFQLIGPAIHVIDYYETSGAGLDHYVRTLKEKQQECGYLYEDRQHLAPHDIEAREWGSGRTREEQARGLGLKFRVVPMHLVDDGINAARAILPRCRFDAVKCERGLNALRAYRAEYDEKHKVIKPRPLHDWSSHASDAFRYLAMGVKDRYTPPEPRFERTFAEHVKEHLAGTPGREERI